MQDGFEGKIGGIPTEPGFGKGSAQSPISAFVLWPENSLRLRNLSRGRLVAWLFAVADRRFCVVVSDTGMLPESTSGPEGFRDSKGSGPPCPSENLACCGPEALRPPSQHMCVARKEDRHRTMISPSSRMPIKEHQGSGLVSALTVDIDSAIVPVVCGNPIAWPHVVLNRPPLLDASAVGLPGPVRMSEL